MLLAFYALGLAVPFILSALAFTTFSGVFKFFRNHYAVITVVSGVILIVMGVLLYTNELTRLNSEALQRDGRPERELLQRALARFRNGTTVFRKRFLLGAAESGSRWLVPRSSTMRGRRILDRSTSRLAPRATVPLVSAVLNA